MALTLPATLPLVDSQGPTFTVPDLTSALLIGSGVLLCAVVAARLSSRSPLPTLLIYLALGVAVGEEGLGVTFDSASIGLALGYSALILILAEGGLTTSWDSIRPAMGASLVLSTLGVAVSVIVVGVAAHYLLNLPWTTAMLIGGILSSTDAAAVFSVLRTVPLPSRITGLLEVESGMNDAPVVILVLALSQHLAGGQGEDSFWLLIVVALAELAAGAAIGFGVGRVGGWIMDRVAGTSSALFAIGILALTVLAYAVAATAHASGFIATYVCGLVLGNLGLPYRAAVSGFSATIGWIAQIGLFVMLGMLASPARLPSHIGEAIVIGLVLLLVARPLSVMASATPFRIPWRDQVFLSWAGLRGAVPIVLATVPITAGARGVEWIFDVVFVLVVLFTAVQAPALPWIARKLGIASAYQSRSLYLESTPLDRLGAEVIEVIVHAGSKLHGVEVFELRLPPTSQVTLLVRDGQASVPTPSTKLRRGDELLVVTTASARQDTEKRLYAVSESGRLAGWVRKGRGIPDSA